MANHPNRKQFGLRLTTLERDALLAIIRQGIERMTAMGRDPKLLERIHEKLATAGETRASGPQGQDDPR